MSLIKFWHGNFFVWSWKSWNFVTQSLSKAWLEGHKLTWMWDQTALFQTSTSSCGWCVLAAAQTRVNTSTRWTTTPPRGSSGWTERAHLPSSTAWCTRCATTALGLSTLRVVSCFLYLNRSGWASRQDQYQNFVVGLMQLKSAALPSFWSMITLIKELLPLLIPLLSTFKQLNAKNSLSQNRPKWMQFFCGGSLHELAFKHGG